MGNNNSNIVGVSLGLKKFKKHGRKLEIVFLLIRIVWKHNATWRCHIFVIV